MSVDVVTAGPRRVCRQTIVRAEPTTLFEIVAHPRQHHDLDGSGTVGSTISGPDRLSPDARFTTHMKQYRVPYSITSHVTAFDENRLIEWEHPLGHRWRWEFAPAGSGATLVTETWDYSTVSTARSAMFWLIRQGSKNAAGIENTLSHLSSRYA